MEKIWRLLCIKKQENESGLRIINSSIILGNILKMTVDNFILLWKQIDPLFFYEINNKGKQDIFTAIALFPKHGGRSGRMKW